MSTPPNPLDALLARARETVRQADAARAAKAKAKDTRVPSSTREAAQAVYTAWVEAQNWALVAKERTVARWTCRCGHVFPSEVVQFFALYEHTRLAGSTREVEISREDHPALPVRLKTMERSTRYCVKCA